MDYKKDLLKRKAAYFEKLGNATQDDSLEGWADDKQIAEDELDAFLDLDFTDNYNSGDAAESIAEDERQNYIEFLKAFGLEDPIGVEPKEPFDLLFE